MLDSRSSDQLDLYVPCDRADAGATERAWRRKTVLLAVTCPMASSALTLAVSFALR